MAETQAVAEPSDCDNLTPCDADNPCALEGFAMDERMDDYLMGCTALATCGGSFCAWDAEACMLECATLTCAMGESYPLTPICTD